MKSQAVMVYTVSPRKPRASERSVELRVAHRDRPNMTVLTELFVRFTLSEANARRTSEPSPVMTRPEVLKQGGNWGTTTTIRAQATSSTEPSTSLETSPPCTSAVMTKTSASRTKRSSPTST